MARTVKDFRFDPDIDLTSLYSKLSALLDQAFRENHAYSVEVCREQKRRGNRIGILQEETYYVGSGAIIVRSFGNPSRGIPKFSHKHIGFREVYRLSLRVENQTKSFGRGVGDLVKSLNT